MKSNPYIAGNPVGGGEAFIGRADVLRDVLRVLKNPKESGIVLYGQRRIGKTSVLQELAASLPQQGPYAPVYFDLQDKAALPLEQVLHELANRILYHLDISEFENEHENFVKGFQKKFLPYVLSQIPEETALVLLFDEFDVLDNPSGKQAGSAFFPYLRDLMSLDTQHLKFIFVIGRRPEDLSSLTLSVFKGVKSRHVSLLSAEDTAALVRLSEKNDSLTWVAGAVEQVYRLTGGHPFLTQQLCQVIWENMYDDDPEDVPLVEVGDIEQAVPEALKGATNSLQWLWDGLKPAQRVVASALAEAGPGMIMQETLEQCLQDSGVRILIGELQNAPKVLKDWDLIRIEDNGYCIPAEMLRRWIVQRKPLSRVQDEIDRIEPVANNLFQAGYGLYQGGQLPEAIPLLQQAIRVNPNHLKANQVLAEIYLAESKLDEALTLLEALFEYQPAAARPRFIQALLMKAVEETVENKKLAIYEKVLKIDPNQPEALSGYQEIWEKKGDRVYKKGNFQEALEAYTKAQATAKMKAADRRVKIDKDYLEALQELERDARRKAQKLLARVLSVEPTFREAARYMYLAVTGVDPVAKIEELERRVESFEKAIETPLVPEKKLSTFLEKEAEETPVPLEKFEFEVITVNEQGRESKRDHDEAQQWVEDLGNGIILEMVAIPGGTFVMGAPETEKGWSDDEAPQHQVTVAPFYMGKFPVTQEQWEMIMKNNPSNFKGAKRPVEKVCWNDAVKFCEQISEKTGHTYRLPSEAEWEYACRAGTTTPFYFGETLTSDLANYNAGNTYASELKGKYREETTEVGIFPPNAFGFYDMHGNVREWCADVWHENYKGAPSDGSVWEEGGDVSHRVLRGGSWNNNPYYCRVANRGRNITGLRLNCIGVRVVVSLAWTLQ